MNAFIAGSQFNTVNYNVEPPSQWDDDYFEQLQAYNQNCSLLRHTPLEHLPDDGLEYVPQVEAIAEDTRNIDLAMEAAKLLQTGQWSTVRLQGQEKRPGGLLDRAKDFEVDPAQEEAARQFLSQKKEDGMEF
jgi:hypothetical protein